MDAARQLPLPFPSRASYADVDFIPAPSNEAALAWLARPGDWPFGRLVLYGPPGSGKTHLLHLWCARHGHIDTASGAKTPATLWTAADLRGVPELPAAGALAVDDADLADETALFHVINAAMAAGRVLLLAGRAAPAHWGTHLPDLASRLRASTAIGIGPAEDELLRPLLARLLAERQLDVPQAIQTWLLLRLPRHPAALAEAVARLDRAALALGRGVTRALAATIVNDMATEHGRADDEILPHPSPTAPALL